MQEKQFAKHWIPFYLGWFFSSGSTVFLVGYILWIYITQMPGEQTPETLWTWLQVLLASLGTTGLGGYLFWSGCVQASTSVSEAGISQLSPTGRIFVRWSDIRKAEGYTGRLKLTTPDHVINIAVFQYKHTDEFLEFVQQQLSRVLAAAQRD